MPSSAELLEPILAEARKRGMDQSGLAKAARLTPECVSRAKRRESMDLSTLNKLAAAAGMTLRVEPLSKSAGLAAPSWGLAWSNPDGISRTALIRAALQRANFSALLEACASYGLDKVESEWKGMALNTDGTTLRGSEQVERILRNIREGSRREQAQA